MPRKHSTRHVPERFLRQLWTHRPFDTSILHTTDGQRIEINSPGILNPDSGPDFKNASVRINRTLFRGDVELHHDAEDWFRHSHHLDPKYNGVILHVVLRSLQHHTVPLTESGRKLPILALDKYLNMPYHASWKTMIANERSERTAAIKCFPVNDSVNPVTIKKWLNKLAVERMEIKIRRFEERLKELCDTDRLTVREPRHHCSNEPHARYDRIPFGINPEDLPAPVHTHSLHDLSRPRLWEQLLYEGVMESLGFSKNQKPFLRLARTATLSFFNGIFAGTSAADEERRLRVESALFHISGLIPLLRDVGTAGGKDRVRDLVRMWKPLRKSYHGEYLSEPDWQFFRLRPENFPPVRIAGAAHLIERFRNERLLGSIIRTVKHSEVPALRRLRLLEDLFIVPADEFWSSHYRFEDKGEATVRFLVGKNRAEDVVLNVAIPVSLLYARLYKDKDARNGALKIFELCPPSAENSITRIIGNQLIRSKFELASAKLQQGALQLHKCYCSAERCTDCAVGNIVFAGKESLPE